VLPGSVFGFISHGFESLPGDFRDEFRFGVGFGIVCEEAFDICEIYEICVKVVCEFGGRCVGG